MESEIYVRPREKIRQLGPRVVSTVELLQLVLGPGTAVISGAKIANSIASLVAKQELTYDELIAIPGVGDAKACRVLALRELADRINDS
jgi:DNA repair protein RadC